VNFGTLNVNVSKNMVVCLRCILCRAVGSVIAFIGQAFTSNNYKSYTLHCLFWLNSQPVGQGLNITSVSRSHTTTRQIRLDSSGRVFCSSKGPLPDNTTFTTENRPFLRWVSNPQIQQTSGRRQLQGPAVLCIDCTIKLYIASIIIK
jgi:hypothetical protein